MKNTFCAYMSRRKNEHSYDVNTDTVKITCVKTGKLCTSQRFCNNENKWIISEVAGSYCQSYKQF